MNWYDCVFFAVVLLGMGAVVACACAMVRLGRVFDEFLGSSSRLLTAQARR